MKKRLLVIGNGMVSLRFLQTFTSLKASEDWEITCFGEEPWPAYDRVHLTSYFTNPVVSDLIIADAQWYKDQHIQLLTSTQVTAIDRANKTVLTAAGLAWPYDILVLATGSSAYVPDIPGANLRGVFVYRTIEDLDNMIAYSKNCSKAAVIGGGLLGLEAAKALVDLKLETSVIDHSSRLMSRQVDQAGADLLIKKVKALGVHVLTNKKTKQIYGNGHVEGIDFAGGGEIESHMVVISAGIRPRDELARACGLTVGDRGGIMVDEFMRSSDPDIFAIGECAFAQNSLWGLVAPGYRMAESVANHLAELETKPFLGADLSTKLKLMGVEVASIGDALKEDENHDHVVLADQASGTYKKLVVDKLTRTLKGAILVGDSSDYNSFLQLYLNKVKLGDNPSGMLVKGGSEGPQITVDSLPEEAVICSCNNVSKGSILQTVNSGIHKFEELKNACKAGTSCGSCQPLVKDLLNWQLEQSGVAVDKSLCEHFKYTRQELYELVKIKNLKTFDQLIGEFGHGRGCEICKPTVANILASLDNAPAVRHQKLQDTNDTFMANIQKNGTYSVVPRIPGGEITPDHLILIGQVAKDFGLYTKITGGQRIDLFGAKLEDLPKIWKRLVDAGLESGHAYAKSVRTVKSCVGSTWCRFGMQDSTGLAIELENRYRGLRSPHKLKFAVSGCARECAEAQGKDVGVIATAKGWNLYICGNGGMTPQHAVLFASDLDKDTLIRYIDRFLTYYIRTADRLTRTATWLNKLPGGIEKVRQVVIQDSLGLAAEMEAEMAQLAANFICEWKETLESPEKLRLFKPFVNAEVSDPSIKFIHVRGQIAPDTRQGASHE